MVRAILEGRKTQTRRVITVPWSKGKRVLPYEPYYEEGGGTLLHMDQYGDYHPMSKYCPYGQPGDRLWVRETWGFNARLGVSTPKEAWFAYPDERAYRADEPKGNWVWRPSIHMPRWASRITLEVVRVGVERVQEITDDDAIEEGVDRTNTSIPTYATQRFRKLWDSINAGRGYGWDTNPWVFVIEFRKV